MALLLLLSWPDIERHAKLTFGPSIFYIGSFDLELRDPLVLRFSYTNLQQDEIL